MNQKKIVLLWTTGVWKTTIASRLAKYFAVGIVEVDDELLKFCNGIRPKDEEKIDDIFEQVNESILKMTNVIFVTSWLEKERIQHFFEHGFIFIELHAKPEILLERKNKRWGFTIESQQRFYKNYKAYMNIIDDQKIQKKLTVSLDTTDLSSDEVYENIIRRIAKL